MTPQVSDFIPGSLEDTSEHIEVADGHHVMEKKKIQVEINMCNDNGNLFIATFHNILLATDLCDRSFLITMLMNLGQTCLFYNYFYMVYFRYKEKMRLLYHIMHNGNMPFGGE